MNAKLERDGLQADLTKVQALLGQRTREEDPIGWLQFSTRAEQLQRQLEALGRDLGTTASVALFFGGRPVVGSRGIKAEFGGRALENFQSAVSVQLAAQRGAVGARGPITQSARDQLLVTDVTRGSFGFILEEAAPTEQLVNSTVKEALDAVVELIQKIASPDEETFEAATDSVDNRVLTELRKFFRMMDDAGATLRIVEGERDFALQRDAIEIAKRRTDDLDIQETEVESTGELYLLPDSRRFELHPRGGETVLRGLLSGDAIATLLGDDGRPRPDILGSEVTVLLMRRLVTAHGREPRSSYRLVRVIELPAAHLGA